MPLETGMEGDVSEVWMPLKLQCCFEDAQGEKFKKFLLLGHATS